MYPATPTVRRPHVARHVVRAGDEQTYRCLYCGHEERWLLGYPASLTCQCGGEMRPT
jgi:hypothetical protein